MNEKMIEFFNSRAQKWDENREDKNISVPIIAKLSGAGENSRVLDIACGTGIMFDELLKLNVKQIVGIDISDKMASIADEKYKDEGKIKVVCSDLLEFNKTGFDIALMYNAYPHFLDKDRVIKHIYNLLNKEGRLIIVHGAGREFINDCHRNISDEIYTELLPVKEEAERAKEYFNIDIMIDTPYLYMLSGVAKISMKFNSSIQVVMYRNRLL